MKKSEDGAPQSDLLYGFKPVDEAVRLGGFFEGDILYVARRQDPRLRALLGKARKAGCEVRQQHYGSLTQLIGHDKHQGIVLRRAQGITLSSLSEEDIFYAKNFSLFLALDGVEDPRNLGAVVRTAAGLGCRGLILAKHGNAPLGATALKTSAGALVHLPVLYVSGLPSFLQRLKEKNERLMIIAATGKAELLSRSLAAALREDDRPILLVIGGEQGLGKLVRERCDLLVSLPITAKIESYNLSVAAAMLLYEFLGRGQLAE